MGGLRGVWERLRQFARAHPTFLGLLALAAVAILGLFILNRALPREGQAGPAGERRTGTA
ncbi:MAG: hypothetical protein K6T75_08290 [Acetobacteraceae bacterium]|nr:hypothetical protein [Acetobacteraceae bacterium]